MYAPSPPPVATAMATKQAAAAMTTITSVSRFQQSMPCGQGLATRGRCAATLTSDRQPSTSTTVHSTLPQTSLVVRLVVFDLVRGLAAGEPVGDCAEIGESEVFARRWSKANVSLDCRSFTASVDML